MRPIRSLPIAVNQMASSGPVVIPNGALPGSTANEVDTPSMVMRPMRSSPARVDQSAPSGPAVICEGRHVAQSS
jgi:hypothetical protein